MFGHNQRKSNDDDPYLQGYTMLHLWEGFDIAPILSAEEYEDVDKP